MQFNDTQTYTKLKDQPKNNTPETIFVHHSGGTDANPLADTSEHTAKGMELWHLGKGWDGLGYHYVIHKDGAIWRGRPEHRNGAHAVGYNSKSIGICLAGNFDATLPTKEQEVSLRTLLLDVSGRYNISDIRPHRSVANKTCYGNKLGDTWAKDLIKEQSEEPTSICTEHLDKIAKLEKENVILRNNINILGQFINRYFKNK